MGTGDVVLASGSGSTNQPGAVTVWEVATGRKLSSCNGHGKEVLGVAFSPDGKRLASAGADKPTASALPDGKLRATGYDGTITLEVFAPQQEYLLLSRDLLRRWWGEP
jgi:hypothetical protein